MVFFVLFVFFVVKFFVSFVVNTFVFFVVEPSPALQSLPIAHRVYGEACTANLMASQGESCEGCGPAFYLVTTLEPQLDIFNLTNADTIVGVVDQIGSRYGFPTEILAPRLVRLGLVVRF